jgi:uncharacterized protein (TIGR00661 family)
MKVMFTVQGEGRGHMTQAISVKQMLERNGHQVVAVLAGGNPSKPLPSFFPEAFQIPVERITSPTFAQKQNRGISLRGSAIETLKDAPRIRKSLSKISEVIEQSKPDLIVNFLEPLLGVYNSLRRTKTPVIAVGHQFMLEHPDFIRVKEFRAQHLSMKQYVRLCGKGSTHLALSFYPAANANKNRLIVSPPLLRGQLFDLKPTDGKYLLVYLVLHGFAPEIVRWSKQNPNIPIHCFYDKPNAPDEEEVSDSLTFHRLHGEKFLKMMAGCRALTCTAGFESVCEGAYLGKPMLLVPVENHYEQYLNSLDAEKTGIALRHSNFNLSKLLDYQPSKSLADFKSWVDRAEKIVIKTFEDSAA